MKRENKVHPEDMVLSNSPHRENQRIFIPTTVHYDGLKGLVKTIDSKTIHCQDCNGSFPVLECLISKEYETKLPGYKVQKFMLTCPKCGKNKLFFYLYELLADVL